MRRFAAENLMEDGEFVFFFFIEVHKCVNLRSSFSFYAEYQKICAVKNEISNVFHLIIIGRLEDTETRCVIIQMLHTVFLLSE